MQCHNEKLLSNCKNNEYSKINRNNFASQELAVIVLKLIMNDKLKSSER